VAAAREDGGVAAAWGEETPGVKVESIDHSLGSKG
jgi:hypothetical protein